MSEEKTGIGFEQKLEMLESLVTRMEGGGMRLEDLLSEYALGMRLSKELTQELEAAQAKMLVLKNGSLKPAEDSDGL